MTQLIFLDKINKYNLWQSPLYKSWADIPHKSVNIPKEISEWALTGVKEWSKNKTTQWGVIT